MNLIAPVTAAPSRVAGAIPPDPGWPAPDRSLAAQVLTLVNTHRATLGLQQLLIIGTLTASSEWKSAHEAFYGYPLNHDDPAPPIARTWYQRLLDNGYPGGACAENIAGNYPTPQAVMDGWLASDGHRQNIENPAYNVTGIGTAASTTYGRYWTQSFGVAAIDPPAPTPPPPPTPIAPGSKWKNKTTGKIVTVTLTTATHISYHGPAKKAKTVTKTVAAFRALFAPT